jgi:PAS domain S-box-containing protein
MAFTEFFDGVARAPRLQIFASDLNEALLEKARAGLYPKTTVQDISPKRLRRFFHEEDGGYRICKPLRETVVFARQNILSDPPFSRIDLLVCRNLLIYLEPGLQKKIMSTFHYALKPKGCLFLGAAEGVGGSTDLFEPLDRKHKIFFRKAGPSPMLRKPFVTPPRRGGEKIRPPEPRMPEDSEINLQREADRVTLNRFAPIGVLVNAELQVLQFRGDTSAFLQPPPGRATFHVLKMARDGLLLPLRAALTKAKKENKVVRTENVRVESKNGSRTIALEVAPLKNMAQPCYLIFFEEGGPKREKRKTAAVKAPASLPAREKKAVEQAERIVELESELGETRDYLQAIREQSEAAREELQASNEEVTSANEELQSVNEELETSKEELESANEELTTVNEEMANRHSELNRLNSDLINLQTSTQLAIILLGRDLTIRSFSARAEKQFNLLASDVGRPLSKVRHNLDLPDLEKFIAGVIDRAREREREVQDKKGRWFSLRVRPYLTLDKKVDGAVLVLVDIDALKRTELKITAARNYAEAIIRTERDPLIVLGPDLRVFSASEAFLQTFQLTAAETKGCLLYELAGGAWDLPRLRELLQEMIREDSFFDDFEVTRDFARIGRRTILLNARILKDESGEPARILLGFQDISKRKQVEEALREAGERLRFMAESMPQKIFTANAKGDIDYFNQQWTEFTGLSFEQIKGWGWKKFIHPDDLQETIRRWQHALDTGEPFELQLRFRRADGVYRWHVSRALPLRDLEGRITMWIGSSPDIDDQKHTEERLRESETRVRALFESAEAARVSAEAAKTRAETATRAKDDFLAALSHELRTPLNPALLLATSLADDAGLPPRLRADIDVIAKAIALQAQLIDDMLDITRITTGKLRLTLQAIDAHGALRHACEILRTDMRQREIEVTLDLAASQHFIKADPVRVQQIFWNVLKNAVKFTPPGGAIAVRTRNPAESAGMLQVEVADTGVGIEPEMLGRVFDAFIQEEHVGAHRFGGVGLGLAITRRLVEVQNGRIRVASPGRNRGATFQIELPLEVPGPGGPDKAPRLPPGATPAKACRNFLVEDLELTPATLVRLLERRGHEVVGVATVAAARQFAATREFDLVISDLGLPDGDGHVLMAGLRDDHGLTGIALSGYGMEEDLALSRMSGFFTHLTKPVDIHSLDAAIAAAPAARAPREGAENS